MYSNIESRYEGINVSRYQNKGLHLKKCHDFNVSTFNPNELTFLPNMKLFYKHLVY